MNNSYASSRERPRDAPTNDATERADALLWQRVDELLAKYTTLPPELQGIAGWRALERGDLETAERCQEYRRSIALGSVTAGPLLERIRDVINQPIVLLKGPEVATVYPTSAVRPFGDLDILVPDAAQAEASLLADGFVLTGTPTIELLEWHHHRVPLKLPGTPLAVELHSDPGWFPWMTPPSNRELFDRAVQSATGVDGVRALPPLEATLFLSVHSWRHSPFFSLLHMIDIELMRQHADPLDLKVTARRWGMERIWQHTTRLLDWCFHDPSLQLSPLELIWSAHIRSGEPRSHRAAGFAIHTKSLAAPSMISLIRSFGTDIERLFTPLEGDSLSTVALQRVRNLRNYR